MHSLKIKKLHNKATIPTKGNPSDAGYDLYSSEKVAIPAGATVLVLYQKVM